MIRAGQIIAWLGAATLAGCVSTSSRSPLVDNETGRSRIAVMAMSRADLGLTVEDPALATPRPIERGWVGADPGEFLRSANQTLDRLAGSGTTLGPARTAELLARARLEERLRVVLADPDPPDAAWKRDILNEASAALKTERFVLVHTWVVCSPQEAASGRAARHGKGVVRVTARLVDGSTGRELERNTGAKEFDFEIGVAGVGGYGAAIIWPYAIGRPATEAFADAARGALLGLSPFRNAEAP